MCPCRCSVCVVLVCVIELIILTFFKMIICLSGFVIAGTSPTSLPAISRNDISASCKPAYSPHHHQLLQHFAPAHRVGGRCSSSSESVSSHSASPPLRPTRVRTLYACLGEGEGELSFEPNQVITHVAPSGEPGWLRGTLDGRSGLVPENYVEPLP